MRRDRNYLGSSFNSKIIIIIIIIFGETTLGGEPSVTGVCVCVSHPLGG